MTYDGLRTIIIIVYLIINILILKLLRISKSKAKVALIISAICFFIFALYIETPIEKNWIKFDTIEQAFKYSYPNQEIVKIIEKDNCAMVIYDDGPKIRTITFFKKVENKWLVTDPSHCNQKLSFADPYGIISDVSTDGKNKFIVVSYNEILGENKVTTVIDNYGTKFERIETMEKSGYIMYDYYGIIENTTGNYYLTIDGTQFLLNTKSYTNIIFIITVVSCGIVWVIIYVIIKYITRKKKQ